MKRLALLIPIAFCACSRDLAVLRAEAQPDAPIIDGFSPPAGLAGQTVVKVEGRNFPSDARVYFGTQEGVWAIGAEYQYSDTVAYAIPPFGSPSQVEISVRGSTGEGRATATFLVFDSEPEITGLSTDRVTATTKLTATGNSFNASDKEARVELSNQEVLDFAVEIDRLTIDLRSTASFRSIGTGWKILRYKFTPYLDGGADETAIPVFVLQKPTVWRVDARAYSRGTVEMLVTGYDSYLGLGPESYADNDVWVGGQKATILGARASTEAPEFVVLTVRLPELGVGTGFKVGLENRAGSSLGSRYAAIEILGPDGLTGEPELAGCSPMGPSPRKGRQFQDMRTTSQSHVTVLSHWNETADVSDALAIELREGDAYAPYTASHLSSLDPFFVQRAASFERSSGHDSFVAVIAANARGLDGYPPPTSWELILVSGLDVCKIPLPAAELPAYSSTNGYLPEFLALDSGDTLGLWFHGRSTDDDLFVVTLPDQIASCGTPLVQRVPFNGNASLAALTHSGTTSYVVVVTGSQGLDYKVSDTGAFTPAQVGTPLSLTRPVALANRGSGYFSLIDTSSGPSGLVYQIDATNFSSSTVSFDPHGMASVVDALYDGGVWSLGASSEVEMIPTWGAAAQATFTLPAGVELQRLGSGSYDLQNWALGGGNNTLGVILGWTYASGAVVPAQPFNIPWGEPTAAWYSYTQQRLSVFYDDRTFHYWPATRTVETSGPQLVARDSATIEAAWGGWTWRFVASIANVAPSSSGSLALMGTISRASSNTFAPEMLVDYPSELFFSSSRPETGYPIALSVASRAVLQTAEDRLLAAIYRVDATHEYLDIQSYHPNPSESDPSSCLLATASRPRDVTFSWEEALAWNGISARLWTVRTPAESAVEERIVSTPRLFLALSGSGWNDLFEMTLEDGALERTCPPTQSLTSRLPEGMGVADASVDPHGRRLFIIDKAGTVRMADVAAPRSDTTAYDFVQIKIADGGWPVRLSSSDGGFALATSKALLGIEVPPTFAGGTIADYAFRTELPFPCESDEACPMPLLRSAGGTQLWLGVRTSGSTPNGFVDRLHGFSALTGTTLGRVDFAPRSVVKLSVSPSGERLEAVTSQARSWSPIQERLATSGSMICTVE